MHQLIFPTYICHFNITQKIFIYIKFNIPTYIFRFNITYNLDTTTGQDTTNSTFLYSFI